MVTSPATVYVVEDDPAVADSLAWLLRSADFEPRVYTTLAEFQAGYVPSESACLVLDIRLPDGDGIQFLDVVASDYPHLPVIFITAFGNVALAVQAMRRGAVDFLEKPFDSQTLIERVRQALAHRCVQAVARARVARLTGREREILDLIVGGLSTRAIAQRLGRSEKTIEGHRHNIMRKVEATSLAQVVHTATLASYTLSVH
ncbi:MAG: response regulator transcription factor [Planctomycetota bacterium]